MLLSNISWAMVAYFTVSDLFKYKNVTCNFYTVINVLVLVYKRNSSHNMMTVTVRQAIKHFQNYIKLYTWKIDSEELLINTNVSKSHYSTEFVVKPGLKILEDLIMLSRSWWCWSTWGQGFAIVA